MRRGLQEWFRYARGKVAFSFSLLISPATVKRLVCMPSHAIPRQLIN
jgi:hypothetical protein